VKEKPTAGSPFFGAFLSDSIPKGTKDVNVRLFIQGSNSRKLYQRITVNSTSELRGRLEATKYTCVHMCSSVCLSISEQVSKMLKDCFL
jgi:hypothetical protein